MKILKKIPVFKTELEERQFWLINDTTDYFNLKAAYQVSMPNLKSSLGMHSVPRKKVR